MFEVSVDRVFRIATTKRQEGRITILELPENLEAALKVQADAHGVSPAAYARQILQRDLAVSSDPLRSAKPFKSGLGMLAKYGPAPSAEDIDENRAEMFLGFAEGID